VRPADTSDLWWRTAVFYCLGVGTFQDSDGDGHGDFDGLAARIDDLAALGVSCLWLLPFQTTPGRDGGYDISDYYGVGRRFGDLGAVTETIRVAHDRGIRVVMDLVINHTSEKHPWFVSARRSRTSRYRDYYVWRDRPPRDAAPTVFPGEEDSTWQYDERTDQYYQHSFYRQQPDLNLGNPAVREEIARIIGFWLKLGIDGFRLDAVPFLIAAPGSADPKHPHAFLRELHRFVGRRSGSALLVGEVGLGHADQMEYFGLEGTELDMQFDFLTCETAFLSFARHDARPLARVLAARPEVDSSQGWVTFLRSNDELSLELLEPDERQDVFDAFAPDETQRVYERGIVRRLAPMLGDDPRRLRLAYSLLFTLPGAPMLYYGEEIGMGESARLPGREAVRTPMQWSAGAAGGFSSALSSKMVARIPQDGYGPKHVNVHDQRRDPESLWSFISRLATRYRSTPAIAWGRTRVLDTGDDRVLAHAAATDDQSFIAVHNFGEEPTTVRLPGVELGTAIDLLTDHPGEEGDEIRLDAYGFRWLLWGTSPSG